LLLQASMLPLCQQQRLVLQDARPAQPSSMRRCLQLRTLLLQAFQQLQQLPQGHLSLPPWTAGHAAGLGLLPLLVLLMVHAIARSPANLGSTPPAPATAMQCNSSNRSSGWTHLLHIPAVCQY
jgi:hypothetical protein